jgi:hypothetical protein
MDNACGGHLDRYPDTGPLPDPDFGVSHTRQQEKDGKPAI